MQHGEQACPGLLRTNEKFDYFIGRTEKDIEALNKRLEKDLDFIRERLDQLWSFRLMLIGGSTVLSALITFMINFWLKSKA